ncbi:unnamed protein product [Pedinophyceae sp. YPF-701]|nr:unnamed protein product [Pedinophyceae sp. YPF-701]
MRRQAATGGGTARERAPEFPRAAPTARDQGLPQPRFTARDLFGTVRGKCTKCGRCDSYWKDTEEYTVKFGDTSRVVPENDPDITRCSRCRCQHSDHVDDEAGTSRERGNDAVSVGQLDEALRHYTRSIQIRPDAAVTYANRAAAYCLRGWPRQALFDADRAIELSPEWAKARVRRAEALTLLGDPHGALQAWRLAHKLEPDNERYAASMRTAAEAAEVAPQASRPPRSPETAPRPPGPEAATARPSQRQRTSHAHAPSAGGSDGGSMCSAAPSQGGTDVSVADWTRREPSDAPPPRLAGSSHSLASDDGAGADCCGSESALTPSELSDDVADPTPDSDSLEGGDGMSVPRQGPRAPGTYLRRSVSLFDLASASGGDGRGSRATVSATREVCRQTEQTSAWMSFQTATLTDRPADSGPSSSSKAPASLPRPLRGDLTFASDDAQLLRRAFSDVAESVPRHTHGWDQLLATLPTGGALGRDLAEPEQLGDVLQPSRSLGSASSAPRVPIVGPMVSLCATVREAFDSAPEEFESRAGDSEGGAWSEAPCEVPCFTWGGPDDVHAAHALHKQHEGSRSVTGSVAGRASPRDDRISPMVAGDEGAPAPRAEAMRSFRAALKQAAGALACVVGAPVPALAATAPDDSQRSRMSTEESLELLAWMQSELLETNALAGPRWQTAGLVPHVRQRVAGASVGASVIEEPRAFDGGCPTAAHRCKRRMSLPSWFRLTACVIGTGGAHIAEVRESLARFADVDKVTVCSSRASASPIDIPRSPARKEQLACVDSSGGSGDDSDRVEDLAPPQRVALSWGYCRKLFARVGVGATCSESSAYGSLVSEPAVMGAAGRSPGSTAGAPSGSASPADEFDWVEAQQERLDLQQKRGGLVPPGVRGRRPPRTHPRTDANTADPQVFGIGARKLSAVLSESDSCGSAPGVACSQCTCAGYVRAATNQPVPVPLIERASRDEGIVEQVIRWARDGPGDCCGACGCPRAAHAAHSQGASHSRKAPSNDSSAEDSNTTELERRLARVAAARQRARDAERDGDILHTTHADGLEGAERVGCSDCPCARFCVLYRHQDANDPETVLFCSGCGCPAASHAVDPEWRERERRSREQAERMQREAAARRAARTGPGGSAADEMAGLLRTLGLPEGQATSGTHMRVVRQAYRRLALEHHPDKRGGASEDTARFVKINLAFKRLCEIAGET